MGGSHRELTSPIRSATAAPTPSPRCGAICAAGRGSRGCDTPEHVSPRTTPAPGCARRGSRAPQPRASPAPATPRALGRPSRPPIAFRLLPPFPPRRRLIEQLPCGPNTQPVMPTRSGPAQRLRPEQRVFALQQPDQQRVPLGTGQPRDPPRHITRSSCGGGDPATATSTRSRSILKKSASAVCEPVNAFSDAGTGGSTASSGTSPTCAPNSHNR